MCSVNAVYCGDLLSDCAVLKNKHGPYNSFTLIFTSRTCGALFWQILKLRNPTDRDFHAFEAPLCNCVYFQVMNGVCNMAYVMVWSIMLRISGGWLNIVHFQSRYAYHRLLWKLWTALLCHWIWFLSCLSGEHIADKLYVNNQNKLEIPLLRPRSWLTERKLNTGTSCFVKCNAWHLVQEKWVSKWHKECSNSRN
jgi:hypothetical protein